NSVNFINNNSFDTYNSISIDDGATWQHYNISDNSTPSIQLPNYIAHDYNGNDLCNGLGIPAWCDGRNGFQTVYTQPYEIPCATNLDLCNPVTPYYKIEKAQNNIGVAQNCAYNIPSTTDIRMFAGNSIHLNSGFHASAGSKFHAVINANCVPENVKRISNNGLINKQSQFKNSRTILSVNPNPVIDELNISLTNLNTETVSIHIHAIDSKKTEKVLENFSIKNLSSANFSFSVKTLNLKAGVYLIETRFNSEVITAKILIQ
ncbi:MAG TPA: T9SS type A sorting domain-containing protein, partial [Bacteroidia bacterium]|nr:T9SS type A sorting domain-containing protein [Bacteroidia bacterium]